jgi:peroxiredoxin/Tfp pilus assembly protein PilF
MKRRNGASFLIHCAVVVSVVLPLGSQPSQTPANPAFQQEFQRGRDALQARKYKDAVDAFKKANKLQKNSCADCYLGMASAYLRMQDLDKALDSSDRAIASAADDSTKASAHRLKGNTLLAFGETDAKKPGQAEAEYRTAVSLDPGVPSGHMDLAVALLRQSKDGEAIVELKTCLSLGPGEPMAEQAKMLITEPRRGREAFAPEFHVTTLQGQDISLKQLAGKIVVLDFWATWCPPCRASVPELKDLTRKYSSDKLVLLSVSADSDEQAWRDFIAKKGMDWPQFLDSDHTIMDSFSVRAFPTYLVIDGDGIIRQRIVGLNEMQSVVGRLKDTLKLLPQLEGGKKN